MRSLRNSTIAGAFAALLLLAGCASGDLGDILGGGGTGTGTSTSGEIRGTVDSVNDSSRYIDLVNVSGSGSSRERVYFDDRTTVEYQGRGYRPTDLERGDEIAMRVGESNGRLYADQISVLRDSSGGTTAGGYGSTVRGVVNYVDTSRQTIELEGSGYGGRTVVAYDSRTSVNYNGREYRPADLERGDEVEIRVTESGGRQVADRIDVIRSTSAGGYGGGTSGSQQVVRGTVRYHDTARREIELEQASWVRGFTTGGPTSTVVKIRYDANSYVEWQGRTHAASGLERGDVIEAEVRSVSSGLYEAERILLIRNARG